MTPRRHLDDLFTSAYEDELSPIDEARFRAHMQSCEPCATAYAEFRTTIEALHELPKARMPHVVHLPSTAPVAERSPEHRLGWSRINLGLLRRFPATALAGGVAVVLLIVAVVHGVGGGGSVATSAVATPGSSLPQPAAAAACTHAYTNIAGASPPPGFTQENLATDPAQPALHLVLAATSLQVTPGQQAVVYAQFSAPVPEAAIPGAASTSPVARAVLPCVSVQVGTTLNVPANPAAAGSVQTPVAAGANGAGSGLQFGGSAGPLLTFQVPAGLAPGTEIHVIATIPANFTAPGSPPLTAELTLTTR
ncbi:MAG: zf-HC2 domain-containing protein [Candidatus Dormiibacterota bacterium]